MQKEDDNSKELSFQQELWQAFVERWKALMQWMLPDKKEHIIVSILKYIYKIPVLLFVLLISPFALLFLVFTFVVLI